jgi:isopentenyl diphosphate isomerase/L-lactate dehydrogenase-like FMN-dependent dehydrogenase
MGGAGRGESFINNVCSWEEIDVPLSPHLPEIAVAPITGIDENVGGALPEAEFHDAMVRGAKEAAIYSCIGDGVPDYKFTDGVAALARYEQKAAIIIKPHPNRMILDRYEMAASWAEAVGVDIDACTLATIEGKAALERKDAAQLLDIKRNVHTPFIIKGICRESELELLEAVRPDIVVISNHGGRVIDALPGIAYNLEMLAARARNFCGEIWVDGGLRKRGHLMKAAALGAKRVLIARPFIQGVAVMGAGGVQKVLQEQYGTGA